MKPLRYLLLFLLLIGPAGLRADEAGPDALVRATISEVLAIVEQDEALQSGQRDRVLALVEAKVLPHFDFARMTRLALGRYWRQASPAQRDALEHEFRALLVRSYTSAIAPDTYSKYKDYSVTYLPLHMGPEDTAATVRTRIIRPNAQPIPVDYEMEKTPDGWKVYDVAVDGVSLVINYRASFAVVIRDHGIDGLIRTLQEKNRPTPPPTPE